MKKLLLIALVISNTVYASGYILISANLNGTSSSAVTPVPTNARGVAGFMLNETRDSIIVNISVTGLSGPITGIHVHEAAIGASGPVIYDLTGFVQGYFINGYITGTDLTPVKLKKYL